MKTTSSATTQKIRNSTGIDVPYVFQHHEFIIPADITGIRLFLEWRSSSAEMMCDLDLILYIFDETAKFIQKLDLDDPVSIDKSTILESDIKSTKGYIEETFSVKFPLVNKKVSSILLFIDGGVRNFQHARDLRIRCVREDEERASGSGASIFDQLQPDDEDKTLFIAPIVFPMNSTSCIGAMVLYRGAWSKEGTGAPQWICHSTTQPIVASKLQEKFDMSHNLVVNTAPPLHKYRPRIFPSVKSICNTLSSASLPSLKEKFLLNGGLPMKDFIFVLFKALHLVKPKVIEPVQAGYTVAMLEELFCQIDFNGDGLVDWEEFTTFCIYSGMIQPSDTSSADDQKVSSEVRYTEDTARRKDPLIRNALLSFVHHAVSSKRILVIEKKANVVKLFDERLNYVATMDPQLLVEPNLKINDRESLKIYSIIYIPWRDVYAYSASDFSIVFYKDESNQGSFAYPYVLHGRICHTSIHVKLCWSEAYRVLISVSLDNTIYGWSLDAAEPLFKLLRHDDSVTDVIALDSYGLVGTCSLDKKIILWSTRTHRVKSVFQGHKRGVRSLSAAGNCLLSAGFECDAKLWNLETLEPALTLTGHRCPISAAKMMLALPDCVRAVTVDESGEFRIWDCLAKTSLNETGNFAEVICVFSIHSNNLLSRITFLIVPFDPESSMENYSNIIGCSSTLTNFIPEAKVAEFIPPSGMLYCDANGILLTSIGMPLSFYSGANQEDITCFHVDRDGRRIFIGNSLGNIILVNFMSGQLITSVKAHQKDITCLFAYKRKQQEILYSASSDGQIRRFQTVNKELNLQHSSDLALGESVPISIMIPIVDFNLILVASTSRCWGLLSAINLKRVLITHEANPLSGAELMGGGGLANNCEDFQEKVTRSFTEEDRILTLAVLSSPEILIYSINLITLKKVLSHKLVCHSQHVYLSNISCLRHSPEDLVNYFSSVHRDSGLTVAMISTADDGYIHVWDVSPVRATSLQRFNQVHGSSDNEYIGRNLQSTRTTTFITMESNDLSSSLIGEENKSHANIISLKPAMSWRGHDDAIQGLVVLRNHGCFVTNSLDGYHHLWNLEQTRLGFIPLPNLSEKMKKDSKEKNQWKFVMEKIPVSAIQEAYADYIVAHINNLEHCEDRGIKSLGTISRRENINNSQSDMLKELKRSKEGLTTYGNATTANVRTLLLRSLSDSSPVLIDEELENKDVSKSLILASGILTEGETKVEVVTLSPVGKSKDTSNIKMQNVEKDPKYSNHQTHPLLHEGSQGLPPPPLHSPIKKREYDRKSQTLPLIKKVDAGQKGEERWIDASKVSKDMGCAFTERSITDSMHEGLIGDEEGKILRKLDPKIISAYERSQPRLALKSTSLATSVKFPSIDVSLSEVNFGSQRHMYKNANNHLAKRQIMSSSQQENVKHAICRARIDYNVSHVGPMIQHIPPTVHEITLPSAMEKSPLLSPIQLPPFSSKLDTDRINKLLERMTSATVEAVPVWEARAALAREEKLKQNTKASAKKQTLQRLLSSEIKLSVSALEKKLAIVITKFHEKNDISSGESSQSQSKSAIKNISLKARDLLPSYKVVDVINFLKMFYAVDSNFTGVLDINEWVMFFTSLNTHMDQLYAKKLFYKIDSNCDGVLSITELLPLIFPKANKDQLSLIGDYVQNEIEKQKFCLSQELTEDDLICLFQYYDEDCIDYVKVGRLREKISSLDIPRVAKDELLALLINVDSCEMFCDREFFRLFKRYYGA